MNELSLKLSPRLLMCAEFVRPGASIADIGTDHAYLPVYLAISGKVKKAIASDLREQPLMRGKQNIEKYNASDKVSVRLSDGLKNIDSKETDDIIIAGMGGELIAKIISETPWLKNDKKHLILQPMSRAEILREYLFKNGFEIKEEKCVLSEGRIYSVMSAVYVGEDRIFSNKEKYIGMIKKSDNEKLYEIYRKKVISRLEKKAEGKRISKDTKEYENIKKIISDIGE